MSRSFDRRTVVRLAAAHLVNDVNQAGVLGMLPFLVAHRGLGYTAASTLVTVLQLGAAVVQPVLGHLGDARPSRLAMPVALVAGASAVATIGLVGTGPMIAAVLVAGVATAAFHPESVRSVRSAAGARVSTALGIYTLGGNVGTAVGPVVATALVGALGGLGPCLLLAPAVVAAWWVRGADRAQTSRPRGSATHAGAGRGRAAAPCGSAFLRWIVILVLRAGFSTCVTAFAPLYLVQVRGWQPGVAGLMLTIALLAGVGAGVIAGSLADRVGRRRVVLATLAPLGPLLVGFTLLPDAAAIACLVVIGAGTMAPYVVAVGAAQDCLPGREGFAAGVAMGVGGALGSLAVLVVGVLADSVGLATALVIASILPVVATVVAALGRAGTPGRVE